MTTRIGRLMAGAGMAALVAGFAGYGSANVEAATATASFNVTATVTANCTIVAGSLGFGSYDPSSRMLPAHSTRRAR
jgi:spore coat protein U-like protein